MAFYPLSPIAPYNKRPILRVSEFIKVQGWINEISNMRCLGRGFAWEQMVLWTIYVSIHDIHLKATKIMAPSFKLVYISSSQPTTLQCSLQQ